MSDDGIKDQIRQVLDRMGELMDARDLAIVDLFAANGAMLVGSEPGEIVRGHSALPDFFTSIFVTGVRVHWAWDTIDIFADHGVGWLFCEGAAVICRDGTETRRPYRLSAVLAREDGQWRLRLFHGSEPKVFP